jgi:hypothetical protein
LPAGCGHIVIPKKNKARVICTQICAGPINTLLRSGIQIGRQLTPDGTNPERHLFLYIDFGYLNLKFVFMIAKKNHEARNLENTKLKTLLFFAILFSVFS